jgi:hypothetical protein
VRQHGLAHDVADGEDVGTLVRIWMSTSMKPRSVTATPAFSALIFLPLGVRPTACSTRS